MFGKSTKISYCRQNANNIYGLVSQVIEFFLFKHYFIVYYQLPSSVHYTWSIVLGIIGIHNYIWFMVNAGSEREMQWQRRCFLRFSQFLQLQIFFNLLRVWFISLNSKCNNIPMFAVHILNLEINYLNYPSYEIKSWDTHEQNSWFNFTSDFQAFWKYC